MEIPMCNAYHDEANYLGKKGVCWGTKEQEPCNCEGNPLNCNFYPEKIKETEEKYHCHCQTCKRYPEEYDVWCKEHCRRGTPDEKLRNILPSMWESSEEHIRANNSKAKTKPSATIQPPSMVEHPQHYNQGGIECIDAANAMVSGYTDAIDASLSWQVIKYLWRHPFKAKPIEDLKKCQWYLERLIKYLENKN